MRCTNCFTFTISFNLPSEFIATRYLEGIVCAHIHICLQSSLSSTHCRLTFATQTQLRLLSVKESITSLLLELVILLAFYSLPPFAFTLLVSLLLLWLLILSFLYDLSSTHLLNVSIPQSSFCSLLFLSLYIPSDYSQIHSYYLSYHWWNSDFCLYPNSSFSWATNRKMSIWHPNLGISTQQISSEMHRHSPILALLCLSQGHYHPHSCWLPNVYTVLDSLAVLHI